MHMQMSSELELVELDDGEIVLRQAQRRTANAAPSAATDDEEPMLRICFSHASLAHLRGMQLDVARHMVAAGIQRYNQLVVDSLQELEAHKSEAESEAELERPPDTVARRLLH